jgi:hypothetical protein
LAAADILICAGHKLRLRLTSSNTRLDLLVNVDRPSEKAEHAPNFAFYVDQPAPFEVPNKVPGSQQRKTNLRISPELKTAQKRPQLLSRSLTSLIEKLLVDHLMAIGAFEGKPKRK